jgi:hypothetical protein
MPQFGFIIAGITRCRVTIGRDDGYGRARTGDDAAQWEPAEQGAKRDHEVKAAAGRGPVGARASRKGDR